VYDCQNGEPNAITCVQTNRTTFEKTYQPDMTDREGYMTWGSQGRTVSRNIIQSYMHFSAGADGIGAEGDARRGGASDLARLRAYTGA